MILSFTHVASADSSRFSESLRKAIQEFTDDRLKVEVQYAHSDGVYSAIVLGREQG